MVGFKTKISLFIIFSVITFAGYKYVDQYERCGPEMLSNNWSVQASKDSTAEINGNKMYLFTRDNTESVIVKQIISPVISGETLQLSADIKCENVRPGVEKYNRARLLLMQYDSNGKGLNLPHTVASFSGFRNWQRYINYFVVDPETERIEVIAQLSLCTGCLWFKNIQLYPVIKTVGYKYFRTMILSIWGVYFTFMLGPCFFNKNNSILLRIMLLLAFILIIIGVTMPAEMKVLFTDLTYELVNSLNLFSASDLNWDPAKVGHFFFFFLLGLFYSLLVRHEPNLIIIIDLLLVAGATEIIQLFIGGRSFLLWDIIIDLNGALYGFILSKLLCLIPEDT